MFSLLLLPGWAAIKLFEDRNDGSKLPYQFLISLSLSYGVFAIMVAVGRIFQLTFYQFSTVIWAYITVACLATLWVLFSQFKRLKHAVCSGFVSYALIACVLLLFSVYHVLAGAYTEIPADIYFHIEKFRQIYNNFSSGELAPIASFTQALKQDVEVWYYLLAWLAITSGASVAEMVQTATLVSQSIFLLGVYHLSVRIFNQRQCYAFIAALATVLVAIHLGVSAFSYLRYYALAPAMLALVIYFCAAIVAWDMLLKRSFDGLIAKILFLAFALLATILIHTQEAMFIALHLSIMLCIFAVRLFLESLSKKFLGSAYKMQQESGFDQASSTVYFDSVVKFFALIVIVVFVAAYLYAHYQLVHFGNNGNRLLELGPAIGVLPQLAILNPSYQFIQVVTLWGLLVYVLFFLNWSRYKHNLFLLSGMLLPALTVFNPFFTDLFLRLTDSTVLWRFCFLIPLHYVAADLVVMYLQRLFSSNNTQLDTQLNTQRLQRMQRPFAGIALASLFILLLPFKNGWENIHYSRYPTLKAVADTQSYQHLDDVIEFLSRLEGKHELLTDPVTGYVLSGFTQHINYRDKFFITPHSGFKRFHFDDYSNSPLQQYAGKLLVVNKRTINNGDSFVGAVTRHWPTDLFKRITPFYPEELTEHLHSSPDAFELQFQSQDIAVYRISSK